MLGGKRGSSKYHCDSRDQTRKGASTNNNRTSSRSFFVFERTATTARKNWIHVHRRWFCTAPKSQDEDATIGFSRPKGKSVHNTVKPYGKHVFVGIPKKSNEWS